MQACALVDDVIKLLLVEEIVFVLLHLLVLLHDEGHVAVAEVDLAVHKQLAVRF